MAAALLALTVLPAGFLMYDKCRYSDKELYMSLASVDDLPGQVGGGEYLPGADETNDDSAWGNIDPVAGDGVTLTDYAKGDDLTVTLTAENTGSAAARIRLPLFAYPGYRLTGTDGAALTQADGYLEVELPAGWQGSVTVRWTGLWYWRVSDAVSALGIAASVVLYRRHKKRRVTA